MAHVLARLRRAERAQAPAHADALAQLAQLSRVELVVELGLPEEQDLDQLRGRGLEVREQPDLLQRLGREVLRLVHDQQHAAAIALLLEQELVELVEQLGARAALREQPELRADRAQQILRREHRIEDEGDFGVAAQAFEQRAAERGLAGADLAGHRDEALSLLDPIQDVRERFAVRRREEEEARIRGQGERLFTQTVERGIHRQSTTGRSLTNRFQWRFPPSPRLRPGPAAGSGWASTSGRRSRSSPSRGGRGGSSTGSPQPTPSNGWPSKLRAWHPSGSA